MDNYTSKSSIIINIVILSDKALTTADVIRNLGLRFRDYRIRMRMTRKEVSEAAALYDSEVEIEEILTARWELTRLAGLDLRNADPTALL